MPWWKFWKIPDKRVKLECDGKQLEFDLSVCSATGFLVLHFIKNKCLGLDQFVRPITEDLQPIMKQFHQNFGTITDQPIAKIIGIEFDF